jgi:hypothetical protein
LHGLFAVARSLECAGHHEQSHEQDQNRPVHESQQIFGTEFRAGQMNPSCGQGNDFLESSFGRTIRTWAMRERRK